MGVFVSVDEVEGVNEVTVTDEIDAPFCTVARLMTISNRSIDTTLRKAVLSLGILGASKGKLLD